MGNGNLSEEERQRIIKMLDEWESVRAGANALKIVGEIVKWCLGIAVAVLAVLGFAHNGPGK